MTEDNALSEAERWPRAQLTDELLASIGQFFGIGPIRSARDLGGTYSLNVRMDASAGRYVARVHRAWVAEERLAGLQRLKERLRRACFPIPEIVAATDGETIFRHEDRLIEVERFIPSDGGADTWERNATAFSLLARLHNFLAADADAASLVPPAVSNYGTPPQLLGWIAETERIIGRNQSDEAIQRARLVCAEAREILLPLCEWWEETGQHLPSQPIHGDYGGGNVLFARERIVGLLDLDFLAVRERIYDLAYAIYWIMARLAGRDATNSSSWTRVKGLISEYNRAASRPLTEAETTALPLIIARVPLYWIAEARFLPDPAQIVANHFDSVRFARWLVEHHGEIGKILR